MNLPFLGKKRPQCFEKRSKNSTVTYADCTRQNLFLQAHSRGIKQGEFGIMLWRVRFADWPDGPANHMMPLSGGARWRQGWPKEWPLGQLLEVRKQPRRVAALGRASQFSPWRKCPTDVSLTLKVIRFLARNGCYCETVVIAKGLLLRSGWRGIRCNRRKRRYWTAA
jgi:hypothetical protein